MLPPRRWLLLLPLLLSGATAASHHACSGPLLSALPDAAFQSSSQSSPAHAAAHAKLNRRDGAGGWSPLVTDAGPWLQVDLGGPVEVRGVATQGRHDSGDWVSSFLLLHSDSGHLWSNVLQEEGLERFSGNQNSEAVVQTRIGPPLRTRFLRFVPLDWNPSGWMGMRVEAYGCSYKSFVADFDGRSSLLYRFHQKSLSSVRDVVSLRFRSSSPEGVLLHAEGQRGDFFTLELHRARLDLYLHLDDSRPPGPRRRAAASAGSLLDDQRWHAVHIERFNRHVNLSVDAITVSFSTPGEGRSLEVDYELSFGGIPLPGKPGTFLRRNFQGCLENLFYNGINVIDLAQRRKPQIHTVGNVTFSCSQPQLPACSFLSAGGSFLSLPAPVGGVAVAPGGGVAVAPGGGGAAALAAGLQFRTWNRAGLLLAVTLGAQNLILQLQLHAGRLRLSADGRHGNQASDGPRLDDGLWHSVSVGCSLQQLQVSVDGQQAVSLQLWAPPPPPRSFHFGGCPPRDCPPPQAPGFQGCMRLLSVGGRPVELEQVQQGLLGEFSQLQFNTCSMRDRCLPNLCEHGSSCSQTWTSFSCNCSGTGYSGATCHSSIYESSCESYQLAGGSSGFYLIDPDGSGPLEPLQVYCNMTDKKVWTVVAHNGTAPVQVQNSSPQNPHSTAFSYNASRDQLRALVSGSEHCQQEVAYSCRRSRLFNTKDGSPLAWWLDRDGAPRSYWGGAGPSLQQCSCSLEGCRDPRHFCNCDADADNWADDSGVLTHKEHLPLSALLVGDTNRTGSQARHRVGPLRCYGDRSLWNAASFYQESSYLYFPTMQAELASDISFYFKTGSPSGVFLENQGLRDFIRVELSSPAVVTFSFDAGEGPAVLAVRAPLPLNDRQWHQVRAERNALEAALQVDALPRRLLQAPPHGRRRLRLSSQLFVGGTASRQRGFLGCLRRLAVGGVVLDLGGRARLTPGVSPGCPGPCSAPPRCQHGGRCLEGGGHGWACDCSQTAYGGATCSQEVSVTFDRESSLTYTFQEPSSVMQNRSSQASSSPPDSRAREDLTFSFATAQRPAMLLTVSTFSQQYIALALARNGSLQVWYRLLPDQEPEVFLPAPGNLADGRLHRVRVHRQGRSLYVQVDQDVHRKYWLWSEAELVLIRSLTLGRVLRAEGLPPDLAAAALGGFSGCLSAVRFNQVSPLKAALGSRDPLVSSTRPLMQSNCGELAQGATPRQDPAGEDGGAGGSSQRDLAVIAGVVTAVVFISVCALAVVVRLLYQRRRAPKEQPRPPHARPPAYGGPPGPRAELHLQPPAAEKEFYI